MASKTKLDHSGHDVWIEVDLREMMGREVSDSGLKEEIGRALTEKIRERAAGSNFKSGSSRRRYSQDYKSSLPYKSAGKSGEVNLKLTGEMLDNLDVINIEKQKIIIGYTESVNKAKAYNHHTGDTVPKREFMCFSRDDIKDVKDIFSSRIPRDQEGEAERLRGFLSFLRGFNG